MLARWLISFLLVIISIASANAQITGIINTKKSYREVDPSICNDPNKLCDFYDMTTTWDDSPIKQGSYRGVQGGNVVEFMNFRIVYPLNYDSNRVERYPVIVMLHGAGESGRIWTGHYNYATTDLAFDNNGANIIHGGQAHLNAVNRNPSLSNAFPGIVIWPQASFNGAWENGWDNGNLNPTGAMVIKVLEWLITSTKNVDPDRIYMHGLSNGAKGTWDLAAKRPDLFAAILPMSGVGSDISAMAPILKTTPLWLFQGGTDTNPRPQAAVDAIAAFQAIGGNPRYTLYPTLGHGTWVTAYGEPDFFPWILSKTKKDIFVRGGDPNICPGGSLELGFSANMLAYQWTLNGADIPGATSRYYNATVVGTYAIKYKRRTGPDVWTDSNPLIIGSKGASTFVPLLKNTGSTNLTIDVTGVDNRINFTAPAGYSQYYWYKNGAQVESGTSNTRQISSGQGSPLDEGTYTVKVLEATGCTSASSNPIIVNWFNPQPSSPRPTQPTITPTSATEATLSWPDYSGEVGYELWRSRFTTNGYNYQGWQLLEVLPANTTTYKDTGLRPEAQYDYLIRALLPSGQAIFSSTGAEWPYGITLVDNTPPTAPTNLLTSNITDTQVTLNWDPSSDNDKVYQYQIYNGADLIQTLSGGTEALTPPATSYTITGLAPNSWYSLNVRALDYRGNYSPFAEGVEVTTQGAANGLNFKYYLTSGLSGSGTSQLLEPGGFNFAQTPTQVGVVSNFDISGANTFQGVGPTGDPNNFVYSFDGYIQIDVAGNYRFYTSSDDGSRLYIDGTLLVNNDGAHGTQVVSAVRNNLAVGKHAIRVTFFENGGGNVLDVKYNWSTGGSPTNSYANASLIPNGKLFQSSTTIVTYYLKTGNESPHLTSSWTSDPSGGSGTSPTNFTNALQYFVIGNRTSVDLVNPWTVSGNGSKVIVGKGTAITLNLGAAFTGKMDAAASAIINVNHATIPQFNVLATTSTVNFNVAGTVAIPSANYGNVNLSTAQYNLPFSNTTVLGNLVMDNGVTTSGEATNLSTLRIGGNLTINNTSGNPFPASAPNQYSLVFTGGTTHTVSFVTPVDPTLFSIQADFGDVVNFTGLTGRTISVGSAQGGGLSLKGSARLNLGNNNLVVTGRGTINNNNETGALSMKGGDLTLTTTATQNNSLYFSAGDSVRNLTTSTPVANRASLLSSLKVNNLVSVPSGELNAGEGYLVLRSLSDAANGTARIGPLLNGAKVTGKITAQRYMSGEGQIWRYISAPVKGVTAATLQQYFPITGTFTGASTGLSTTTSMYHYTEPNYVAFPAAGGNNLDTLKRGKGYTPFIREATAPTVMSLVGEPYQGTIPFTLTGGTGATNDGWNLLGNPYAAPIQWTGSSTGGWTLNGVNSVIYIRENDTSLPGGYRWRSSDGSQGLPFDGTIAPGQAFWVRTTIANPTLTISESAKKTTDGAFYREGWPDNVLEVVMKSGTTQDAAYIRFVDGATPNFDTDIDGVKQDNSYFNLSTLTSDNKALVINQTTTNFCEQEIKLRIANAAVGTYELNINGVSSLVSSETVTFYDHFTQTEKVISESEVYTFSITADAASKADGRFTLRFGKPAVTLNQTLKTDAVCDQVNPVITINNSQPGVTYQAFHNGTAISQGLTSAGGTLELSIDSSLIPLGTTTTTVKAGFKGCNSFELPMTISVQRDTLAMPEIIQEPLRLVAKQENAQYQWYFNGEELKGQTGRELLAPVDGLYFVEVTLASCSKNSDTINYVVTALEKPARANQVYPNPTRDKIVVTLEQPINFSTMRVMSAVGQVLQAPTTRLTAESAEIEFSQLPVGLYVLQVNGQRYRVLKE